MISIKDKKNCCGCNACVQKCQKKCITMVEDTQGFMYPSVNKIECINCGLCEKVCPVANVMSKQQNILAYAAYADDNIRMKSSSGGLFTLLAEKILDENGVVFGAAFDNDFLVHHISIESKDELFKLQGSKYLQSQIENTYVQVENHLKNERKVLFTGTACQIAGLKNFLGKEYEQLYTVDVLCHGVPSPKLWQHYLKYQENCYNSQVTQVFFRSKKFGWRKFSLQLQFNNSSIYEEVYEKDMYMKLFLSNICLRPSCHDCKYKKMNRPSDITIGDSWGIEKYMPEMDDDKGTSVVLIHSQKGKELFDSCKNEMLFKEAEVDQILPPHADSRKSVAIHSRRSKFFKELNAGSSMLSLMKLLKPRFLGKVKRKIKKILG